MTDVMDDARRIKRGILDFIHTYGCEQAPIDDSRHAHMTYQR